jgi:hypothetical protein
MPPLEKFIKPGLNLGGLKSSKKLNQQIWSVFVLTNGRQVLGILKKFVTSLATSWTHLQLRWKHVVTNNIIKAVLLYKIKIHNLVEVNKSRSLFLSKDVCFIFNHHTNLSFKFTTLWSVIYIENESPLPPLWLYGSLQVYLRLLIRLRSHHRM